MAVRNSNPQNLTSSRLVSLCFSPLGCSTSLDVRKLEKTKDAIHLLYDKDSSRVEFAVPVV